MDAENYVIQYPLDAVHVDKFADLLGNWSCSMAGYHRH